MASVINEGNPVQADGPKLDADVVVIGAGPAGMSAAIEAAEAGCRVIVIDMQPAPGGQIYRSIEANFDDTENTGPLLQALGPTYSAGKALVKKFRSTAGIDYRPNTTVWELRADGTVGWLNGMSAGFVRGSRIVLANGAMERPIPFPGWTLPGVMTAGAVQTLLKAGRLKPEGKIVLAGTGPLIMLLADQLRRLGVRPVLIARTDCFADKVKATKKLQPAAIPAITKGLGWIASLKASGIKTCSGVTNIEAHGDESLTSVSINVGEKRINVECDMLIVHDGIIPSVDLAHGAGIAMRWNAEDKSWRPITNEAGLAVVGAGPALTEGPCRLHVAGDARDIGGAEAAIAYGRFVGANIACDLGKRAIIDSAQYEATIDKALAIRPFIDTAFPAGLSACLPSDDTIVCRCEELSAGTLRQAIRDGARDMNLLRGVTRCGMGHCQGRHCSVTLARLLEEQGIKDRSNLPFRARPPLRPIPLGALANLQAVDPELAHVVFLEDKPEAVAEGEKHDA
jgi:NADPH-dependent 2,4-dienoyl-CoA reductase/sulfur reductase-like enzyme